MALLVNLTTATMSSSSLSSTAASSSTTPSFLFPPPNWPSSGPANLSHGLDQRSSLRKLSFPSSTRETLLRLLRQCATFVGARKQPSPREMEVVLDAIDEFIFNFTSGAKQSSSSSSSVAVKNLISSPALIEMQMIQTLFEFFNYSADAIPPVGGSFPLDRSVFVSAFIFVFMEPMKAPSHSKTAHLSLWREPVSPSDQRLLVMAKLVSLALANRGKGVLECVGVWMHQEGAMSERPVRLARFIIQEHLAQVRETRNAAKSKRRRHRSKSQSASNAGRRPSRLMSQDSQSEDHAVAQKEDPDSSEDESEDAALTRLFGDLPSASEIFCCNFMTAACQVYFSGDRPAADAPPTSLVRLFAHWIKAWPLLPLHCVLNQQPGSQQPLPPGGQVIPWYLTKIFS